MSSTPSGRSARAATGARWPNAPAGRRRRGLRPGSPPARRSSGCRPAAGSRRRRCSSGSPRRRPRLPGPSRSSIGCRS
ncbi:hypothetical protein FV222_09535 [Methylobacterium sp. WL103]|nr:hypothetical protein FV222_09535 [Methylobacterium sp. WL103]